MTYCPLPWTTIEVSGLDAQKFLQGQLTCDVAALGTTGSSLGAHCNAQGRVLATFYIIARPEAYWLCLPTSIAETTLKNLKKYALFSKVALNIKNHDWQIAGFSGAPLENLPSTAYETLTVEGLTFLCLPGNDARYLAMGQQDTLQTFTQCLTPNEWELMDIQAGLPWITPQTQGLLTPHDIEYPALGGVSFQKGCYTGQEIIARMEYRGKPKYTLCRLKIQSAQAPVSGERLYADTASLHSLGTIINAAQTAPDHYELLSAIQHLRPSEALFWAGHRALIL